MPYPFCHYYCYCCCCCCCYCCCYYYYYYYNYYYYYCYCYYEARVCGPDTHAPHECARARARELICSNTLIYTIVRLQNEMTHRVRNTSNNPTQKI